MRRIAAVLLLALTGGCHAAPGPATPGAAVAVVVDVRDAIQAIAPPPTPVPVEVSPAAVEHIVRWEISSPAHYQRRLRWPIWPGGASGVTWCIGYDGGHQTRHVILRDWVDHTAAERLATTAGITGTTARQALPHYRDISTDYGYCRIVFQAVTLPAYHRLAQRTFADGWGLLPADARGTLTATVYNRGAAMRGTRRTEMRTLRDECVPAGDVACMARQYRSMCRLWRGTPNEKGLCARYEDAARIAEGSQ